MDRCLVRVLGRKVFRRRRGAHCGGKHRAGQCRCKPLHLATSTTIFISGWIEHSTSTVPGLSKATFLLWPWA